MINQSESISNHNNRPLVTIFPLIYRDVYKRQSEGINEKIDNKEDKSVLFYIHL